MNDTAATPAAVTPAAAYENATYDLAVDMDSLGHSLERFVSEQQQLLRVHRELARAARRVVQAYHDERLVDGALVEALDLALVKARTLDPHP